MRFSDGFTRAWKRLRRAPAVRLLGAGTRQSILSRYGSRDVPWLGYGTVEDFCDSVDHLSQVCHLDGDLKNVQRPWAVKAVVSRVAPGGRLVEIGAGVPTVAGLLAELGYQVTAVDPYQGAGNGPTEYERYVRWFPHVRLIRSVFDAKTAGLLRASVDGIYSVSVLEHLADHELDAVFAGIGCFLRPGGVSLHCVDHVVEGDGADWHARRIKAVIAHQIRLSRSLARIGDEDVDREYEGFMAAMKGDLETFYLSPQGHQLWRGTRPYREYRFRKVVSVQTCVRAAGEGGS